jgi:hypothetical protein
MEVEVGLVLLVLVQVDGAGGDDGREAERDRDDDVEPPSERPPEVWLGWCSECVGRRGIPVFYQRGRTGARR